jgi:GT2 family glycosyltransferase
LKEGETVSVSDSSLISVVVLNWNGGRVIEECLISLQTQTYSPMEIIVVDNASTDSSADLIKTKFPHVRLIVNDRNLGFGGGNNVGIRASRGRYIMVLNNDARLDPQCIEELRKSIEKDKRYGASASKILLDGERGLLDAAGINIYMDGLSIGRGRLERADRYQVEEEVFFASGCASLFRKEMLDDIGLFDEDFFAYADDTDMGWRAQLAGWRCIYNPKAIVYHSHSASSSAYSQLKAFLVERNRIWVAIKYFPISLLVFGQLYALARYFYQTYGALFGKGAAGRFTKEFSKLQLVKVLLKVYVSVFKNVPMIFRKRAQMRRRKRISDKEIYELFGRFGISGKEIAFKE